MSNDYHSFHIFMFPFRIEMKNVSDLHGIIEKSNRWINNPTDSSSTLYTEKKFYHELAHPCIFPDSHNSMIRQYVYNCQEDDLLKGNEKLFYSIHINRRIPLKEVDQIFQDEIIKPPDRYRFEKKTYSLILEKISLDVYDQGIGIFSLHLGNKEYKKPEEILLINQFGRRLYPPFLDDHFMDFKMDFKDPLTGTQHREMPISISIGHSNLDKFIEKDDIENRSLIYEDFTNKDSQAADKGSSEIVQKFIPVKKFLPGHIGYFFGAPKSEREDKSIRFSISGEQISLLQDSLTMNYVLDDRMFVLSWYGAYQLTYDYRKQKKTEKEEKLEYDYFISGICNRAPGGYETSGFSRNHKNHKSLMMNKTVNGYGYSNNKFWYQYMFVDGFSPTCSNELIKENLIEEHTYARWVEANTLYGITRYSFVCITEPQDFLTKEFPNAGFIIDHLQTIYFQMVSLALFQRAMVLKYAEEASKVSRALQNCDMTDNENSEPALIKEIETLLKNYTEFINRVFHREVTAQEQGIELYDMLQKHLRIEYQAKELEKEIDELHRNADLITNRQSSKSLDKITILGGLFLIPSLIAAFAQVGWFDVNNKVALNKFPYWLLDEVFPISYKSFLYYTFPHGKLIGVLLFLFISIILLFRQHLASNKTNKLTLFIRLFFFSMLFIIFYPALTVVLGFTTYVVLIGIGVFISEVLFRKH